MFSCHLIPRHLHTGSGSATSAHLGDWRHNCSSTLSNCHFAMYIVNSGTCWVRPHCLSNKVAILRHLPQSKVGQPNQPQFQFHPGTRARQSRRTWNLIGCKLYLAETSSPSASGRTSAEVRRSSSVPIARTPASAMYTAMVPDAQAFTLKFELWSPIEPPSPMHICRNDAGTHVRANSFVFKVPGLTDNSVRPSTLNPPSHLTAAFSIPQGPGHGPPDNLPVRKAVPTTATVWPNRGVDNKLTFFSNILSG